MKNTLFILLITTLFSACAGNKNATKPSIKENVKNNEQYIPIPLKSDQYIVKNIEFGKDGYVATLRDYKGQKLKMIASIPNMGNAFVQVKNGEVISVKGEYFEKMNLIKAEKITVHRSADPLFVPQDIMVGFKDKTTVKQTIKELEKYKGVQFAEMIFDVGNTQIALFKVPAGKEKEFARIFAKNKNVKYAERNRIMKMIKK